MLNNTEISYTFLNTFELQATFIVADGTKYVKVQQNGGTSLSVSLMEYTARYGFNRHLYMADMQYDSYIQGKSKVLDFPTVMPKPYELAKAA